MLTIFSYKRRFIIIIKQFKALQYKSVLINKTKENNLSKKDKVFLGQKKIFEIKKDTSKKTKKTISDELDNFDLIKEFEKNNLSKSCKKSCNNFKKEFFDGEKESNKKEDDVDNEEVFQNICNVENNLIRKKLFNNKCESGIKDINQDIHD